MGIDENRFKNRSLSRLKERRSSFRSLLCENLERRDLMAAAPIFAQGTSQAYADAMIDQLSKLGASGINNGGGNGGGNNGGGTGNFELQGSRWVNPTGGLSPNLGDSATVSWSIVPDGTPVTSLAGGTAPSTLIAFMDGIYGGGTGPVSDRPWFSIFQRTYDGWSQSSGLNYIYEPQDDGAPYLANARGVTGVRGDVRIGGNAIDGDNGILAFNFFPTGSGNGGTDGDMVIDTSDSWYSDNSDGPLGENRGLFNVLSHEAGHGLGLAHVIPVNETKLMEPFVSLAFSGPQHDDVLAAQTLYGDDFENNDSNASASNLGVINNGTTEFRNLSVDRSEDTDVYLFTVGDATLRRISVEPVGFQYLSGPQGGTAQLTNSLIYRNLSFQIERLTGEVVASATTAAIGLPEIVNSPGLAAGSYLMRVSGTAGETQLYTLKFEADTVTSSGPILIGVQPNNSQLIENGVIRTVAPRELTFRFDDSQIIDAATTNGIRVTRAGGDGSFGLPSASTDFGTNGRVDVQWTSKNASELLQVVVSLADLGAGVAPQFTVVGTEVRIVLNSRADSAISAGDLVNLINSPASPVFAKISAKVNGGFASTKLGLVGTSTYSPVRLVNNNDVMIVPGAVIIGDSPNENEVTLRFAENLPDDNYRLEVFGFDDPTRGVTALRNTNGDLFVPRDPNTRQDTIQFRLDLGTKITGVVPQPVVRNSAGVLVQQRDTVVVYFDDEKLFVENTPAGLPAPGSVENPDFYQLIYTSDTVRNTDDVTYKPMSVVYNASANTATLRFSQDINTLPGSTMPNAAFRLRIGTRETTPMAPVRSEATASAISDLNTNGLAKIRFTAKALGEAASGLQVDFINTNVGGGVTVSLVAGIVTVDLASDTATVGQVVTALQASAAASALMTVSLEPGSDANAVAGNRPINYSPVTLVGLGSSFDTAGNLGTIGSASVPLTSLLLTSNIDPEVNVLDLLGSNTDPGLRNVPEAFENYINPSFTGDNFNGIRTIYYNFQSGYGTVGGVQQSNAITDKQKARIREAFALWSEQIGVQFVETPNSGLTMALGTLNALTSVSGRVENAASGFWGVRIDPNYQSSLAVFSADNTWNDNYGENMTRAAAASIGLMLGLARAGDSDPSTLMNFDNGFINFPSNADRNFEPVFPGNLDVLRASYLHNPESSDIDLYRFDVDFGPDGATREGAFTIETLAERAATSSSLDTRLALYKQTQATAISNLGAGGGVQIEFTAVKPGKQGNNLQIFVTRSNRGVGEQPIINVFPNAITIDLNSTLGSETSLDELLTALDNSSAARQLVSVKLLAGDLSTLVGNRDITYSPITLAGGSIDLIAQNDDYFGKDSLIRLNLDSGVYYIGVSASGNDAYDASIPGTGNGGRTQGRYDLRLTFRAQTDGIDTIRDVSTGAADLSVPFDGDADGVPGGVYNFWFETRPLDRVLNFNAGGTASLEGRIVTVTGGNGVVRRFEFSADANIGVGNTRIAYNTASTPLDLASALALAINSRTELAVTATSTGASLKLQGERLVQLSSGLTAIDIAGKTIFVDKSAGPNADGSLAKPFNNIAGTGVANAFAATIPGDIVRIVGNGGVDGRLETVVDNFAYEIGFGILAGTVLSDGSTMDVPKGVSVMVDAGAVFKLRRSRIGVGSSTIGVDRSGGALQVLGTPKLLNAAGNAILGTDGKAVSGSVFFTSWLDQGIGLDNYAPSTTPSPGDWGGLVFRRDLDKSVGRSDLEDEGVFRQYVNNADIRFGGSSAVVIDSSQQVVNSIQITDMRPTVTFNRITRGADSAISATPDSFEETLFSDPRYQRKGSFTPDYDRVGPKIHGNTLVNNSINGMFIKVSTPAGSELKQLTVSGRFDDTDVVHVIAENIIVQGNPGAGLLDTSIVPSNLISMAPELGGVLTPGSYRYKITYVDSNGYETPPSDATVAITLTGGQTAIRIAGLPGVGNEYVSRRLYRNDGTSSSYRLVAELDGGTSSFTDRGTLLASSVDPFATLLRDRPDVSGVGVTPTAGGSLALGNYTYRIVMIDAMGRESLASSSTVLRTATAANRTMNLTNLPAVQAGYTGRRIYRSSVGGAGTFTLVAELNNPAITSFIDNGTSSLTQTLSIETSGNIRPRLDASLAIDPGTIIKLEGARIELGHSSQLLAEGVDGSRVVFTSRQDDRFGAGGTFDTNNNGLRGAADTRPGDWSGIYVSPGANISLDHVVLANAGGISRIEGTFKAFSPVEIQQGSARISNSVFENNANGMGGQGPIDRLGRPANENFPFGNNASRGSTVFVRGSQPIFLDNIFQNNVGTAITIDANSMDAELRGDLGRQTGMVDRNLTLDANRGPLLRGNRLFNNSINGLEIRADATTNNRDETVLAVRDLDRNILTTESVWDDTDIVHVLFDSITVSNLQHVGGLRLQSSVNESLVIKLEGQGSNFDSERGTGITATGRYSSMTDRVGGTVHVLGMPGFPVVFTSLRDDTVGAGTQPNGLPQTDTNNDGIASIPRPGDWRSLLFDTYSNDRNVATVMEIERANVVAPGVNDSVLTAQLLGALAPNASKSDENLGLGWVVQGVLSEPADQDLYSFTGVAGTEVWFDVDSTEFTLDTVLEILNANGELLARSDDSTAEQVDPSLIYRDPSLNPDSVNPIVQKTRATARRNESGLIKEDGTTNTRDAGLRVLLPGVAGAESTFFFRIRSKSTNIENSSAGITSGAYTVQVRLRDEQEFAGSTVQYADIRYATNGVHAIGLPFQSPLTGEANVNMYDGTPTDGITNVGPLQLTSKGAISVAGLLPVVNGLNGTNTYEFSVGDLASTYVGAPSGGSTYPVVIDIDYADGLNRAALNVQVFRVVGGVPTPVAPLVRDRTAIVDDLPSPLSGADLSDLSRGSVGSRDPFLSFIGTAELTRGTYRVVVSDPNGNPANRRSGVYQLEIRTGDAVPTMVPRFYRGSYSTTVQFLPGLTIASGSTVEVSDGPNRVTLEFTTTGNVVFGNVPVLISVTDTPSQLGDKFRDTVNQLYQQNRLNVRAADTNGVVTGAGNGVIDLFGNVEVFDPSGVFTVVPGGASGVLRYDGFGDQNSVREQGQFTVSNTIITKSRDYAVWSAPADKYYADGRAQQPTFLVTPFGPQANYVAPPTLGGAYTRNLPVDNLVPFGVGSGSVAERAGVAPGMIVVNNIFDSSGLGGLHIQGETPTWQITAFPGVRDRTTDSAAGTAGFTDADHSGTQFDDGDFLDVTFGRQRVRFEFEDMAGAPTGGVSFGSGVVGGNGWNVDNIPIYYREDAGAQYLRAPNTAPGYATDEMVKAIRDAFIGSALVTNGTTLNINSWVLPQTAPIIRDPIETSTWPTASIVVRGPQNISYVNTVNNPNPLSIVRLGEFTAAPFVRAVNNTIIGNDGLASSFAEAVDSDSNDTIAGAAETFQGVGINPQLYSVNGTLTPDPLSTGSSDVDMYKFKLEIGDRVRIDVDTTQGSTLNAALKIFDSSGVGQVVSNASDPTTSDDRAAPGEPPGLNPYIDFTATKAGVYYVGVSASGNTIYDPLSFADRRRGGTSGDYTLIIEVIKPEEFVMVVDDPATYADGETFTIQQIPDLAGTTSNSRTFEFTRNANYAGGNIPVFIGPEYRVPDLARSIATAISLSGLTNTQLLPNGALGTANPLAPVSAIALGGHSGFNPSFGVTAGSVDLGINSGNIRGPQVQAGLNRYNIPNGIGWTNDVAPGDVTPLGHGFNGFGHDRTASGVFGSARGNGTSEKFVIIRNAYSVRPSTPRRITGQPGSGNMNQLIPETGIMVSGGASPTLLNNTFINVQSPIIQEKPVFVLPGGPDLTSVRPSAVVVGGNTYQYIDAATPVTNLTNPIEAVPTNVPNTGSDFNFIAGNSERLLVDFPGQNFLPGAGSQIIDSSIDSLPEREGFRAVKDAVGISPSPILAPDRDFYGIYRADDPSVAPPSGLGGSVFKDRGAIDRADFVGPSAISLNPIDNDAQNVDIDRAESVMELTRGVYPEFRIQLQDGFESANLGGGTGINDDSVVGRAGSNRTPGAVVTITENGRLLVEGIDYVFSYNTTTNEIVLKPLAGVWKNDRVYDITINNKDRFVINATSGEKISDGETFTIRDANRGDVTFEFDSGYRLQLPQGLQINLPIAGGGAGGIVDGDRFAVTSGGLRREFEFDSNNNTVVTRPEGIVRFTSLTSKSDLADAILVAINSSFTNGLLAKKLDSNDVFVAASKGSSIETANAPSLSQPVQTLGLQVPSQGTGLGGISDGQTFSVTDGRNVVIFEFDTDTIAAVQPGNIRVDVSQSDTAALVADAMVQAINSSVLSVSASVVGGEIVHLGLPRAGRVDLINTALVVAGVSRAIQDGDSITISRNNGGVVQTFEFNNDGSVQPGNISVPFTDSDTQSEIGESLEQAIAGSGLGLMPVHFGNGNVVIGGLVSDAVSITNAPTVDLFGQPGVQGNTVLQIFGTLQLLVPVRGGAELTDNSTFTITNNGTSATFEFDGNFSGPSSPNNVVIRFTQASTQNDVLIAIVAAINSTTRLGINARDVGSGRIDLGLIETSAVSLFDSGLATERGVVQDGDFFSINNGTNTVTFEFENLSVGNGRDPSRVPIRYTNQDTTQRVYEAMQATIKSSLLNLDSDITAVGLQLRDNANFVVTTDNAPSLRQLGVPGGSIAIPYVQDPAFDGQQMRDAIIRAINTAFADGKTPLQAKVRGGSTLFVENAISISPEISSYFLRGVQDVAGNFLKSNRINNETQFTILMPGVQLDFGDAPDPFTTTQGRYPTLKSNDGARHVVNEEGLRLGPSVTSETEGIPQPLGDGDNGDDGVSFRFQRNDYGSTGAPLFNKNVDTEITVTLSQPGLLNGWIDFNFDGDWNDPGEHVFSDVVFDSLSLTQTLLVHVPATAPNVTTETIAFARFRASTASAALPTGLALDGEVEDYRVRIVPGLPPIGNDDAYAMIEDQVGGLSTTDPLGLLTPAILTDNGLLANDGNPDNKTLSAVLVQAPSNAALFNLRGDGTFDYQPAPNFFGTDTFEYTVTDGVLDSLRVSTVTITVSPVNDAPTAGNLNYNIDEDVPLVIPSLDIIAVSTAGPANESDQQLTITRVDATSVRGGTVTLVNGVITYTPPTDFNGLDSFTYTLIDEDPTGTPPNPLTSNGTIFINVADKNDPPITTPKFITTDEDVSGEISIVNLIAGDVAGPPIENAVQTVTFSGVSPTSANGGTVIISGSQVIYTPRPDFNGEDTFTYTVTDNGTSAGIPDPQTSTGTVTVTVRSVNDTPTSVRPLGTVTMAEDDPARNLLLSDYFTDVDIATNGDVLSYRVVSNTNTQLIEPTFSGGNLVLIPKADQNGSATIVIEARDIANATVTSTLTVVVTSAEDTPRLVTPLPNRTVAEDSAPILFTLSPTYFFDPDVINGDTMTFTATSSNLSLAVPTISGNQLQLVLAADANGESIVSVTATDTTGRSVTGSFTLTVTPVNDAPIVANDRYDIPQGVTLVTTDVDGTATTTTNDNGVLANDRDIEGDSFTAILTVAPTRGTVTLNTNGTFTYVPGATALTGTSDTFRYRTLDAFGAESVEATVTINIGQAPAPRYQNPVLKFDVNADSYVSPIDVLIIINLLNSRGPSVPVAGLPGPPDYVDVNGNNVVEPLDALEVINYINAGGRSGSGGEGEGGTQLLRSGGASVANFQMDVGNGFSAAISMQIGSSIQTGSGTFSDSALANAARPWDANSNRLSTNASLADYLASLVDEDEDDDVLLGFVHESGSSESSAVDRVLADLFIDE